MCGIVGIVRNDGEDIDQARLGAMCDAIAHRGPDDDGFYVNGSVGLGMRRLSIIDLKTGQQPIHNADRSSWIVFNGEIYNYLELREKLEKLGHTFYTNSDTEAIVHAYDQYGADCPKHLRGMFAFAIWNQKTQELFLARDRVGKKPLLYADVNGEFIFGSEFSALLTQPKLSREVNPEAIHYYLSYMCVPAPLTAYRSIKKLEPGHSLRLRKGEIKIECYWQPDFSRKTDMDEVEAGERTIEILRDAVRVRLMSEVPLGAFLSGGIDSSTVVALMSQEMSTPVKTFSIGFEEQDFSELHHARRIAEHVGADHHEFIVRPDAMEVLPTLVEHYGEPYADSSAVPTYYVARETRRHVTVALNGDGGDECFGGYQRYVAMRLAEKYHKLPQMFRQAVVEQAVQFLPGSERERSRPARVKRFMQAASLPKVARYLRWVSVFHEDVKSKLYSDEFQRATREYHEASFLEPWFVKANGAGIVDATMLADTMNYLPNDLLVKVDIASMAVSLEARSPFLDHHVIEFAASLPEHYKVRGLTTKYLLKRVLKGLLPADILSRPKMGFGVPVGKWFRNEMQGFVREVLLSDSTARRGLFKPEAVKHMVEEHVEGRQDFAHQLWSLLMLELWYRRFID